MRLIFTDPHRPKDQFVIDGKTISEGETIVVSDKRGRELLAAYHPRLQLVEGEAGSKTNPTVVAIEKNQPERAAGRRAAKK